LASISWQVRKTGPSRGDAATGSQRGKQTTNERASQIKAPLLCHRLTNNRISKSMAKKITMMASSHNILCSFNSV